MTNGTSTPLENIQVSIFLVVWSSFLLTVLRMVRNEKETKSFARAENLRELAQDYAKRTQGRRPAGRQVKGK